MVSMVQSNQIFSINMQKKNLNNNSNQKTEMMEPMHLHKQVN